MFLGCLQAVLALPWSEPRLRGRGKQGGDSGANLSDWLGSIA
jgi:hypothetical protein